MNTDDLKKVFGQVTPPPGVGKLGGDPVAGVGHIISTFISLFLVGAGLLLLAYMLWGALDWIISGGEKEKISKAQNKITNALVGIIIVFAALTVYGLVAGEILGIIKNGPNGWQLKIPTLKP